MSTPRIAAVNSKRVAEIYFGKSIIKYAYFATVVPVTMGYAQVAIIPCMFVVCRNHHPRMLRF